MLIAILFHALRDLSKETDGQKLDACIDGLPDCNWIIVDCDFLLLGVYTTVEFEPVALQDKLTLINRLRDAFPEFTVSINWEGAF